MLVAVATGRRGAAFATAAFGVAALLLFLLLDLPEAGNTGTVEGDDGSAVFFATAKAEPQIGFWLEAIGSLTLGLAAIAFATLRSEQLRAPALLLARRREQRGAEREERAETQTRRTEAAPAQGAPKPSPGEGRAADRDEAGEQAQARHERQGRRRGRPLRHGGRRRRDGPALVERPPQLPGQAQKQQPLAAAADPRRHGEVRRRSPPCDLARLRGV